jgi:hypothetical protein
VEAPISTIAIVGKVKIVTKSVVACMKAGILGSKLEVQGIS